MAGIEPHDAIVPGRSLRVTFDVTDYTLCQPAFRAEAVMSEIQSRQSDRSWTDIRFVTNLGYMIDSASASSSYAHEKGSLDSHAFSSQNSTIPSSISAVPYKRWLFELNGVPQGDQIASGDLFLLKSIGAGDDWSTVSNTGDQEAYPSPSLAGDIVPLDRILTSIDTGKPDDVISARFFVPESGGAASDGTILKIMFAGCGEFLKGVPYTTGEYCASFRGDGVGLLTGKKLSDGSWVVLREFRWSYPHQVAGRYHMIRILSDAFINAQGKWQQGRIIIQSEESDNMMLVLAVVVGNIAANDYTAQYIIAGGPKNQPVSYQPVRLDVRRDLRMRFQISYDAFLSTGTLFTKVFNASTPFLTVDSQNPDIFLTVFGANANGTSISASIYWIDDSTGDETIASGSLVYTSSTAVQFSFQTRANASRFYFKLTLNASSDGSRSPVINRIQIDRDSVSALPSHVPTPIEPYIVSSASFTSAQSDPTIETASFRIPDLTAGARCLYSRSSINVRAEMVLPDSSTSTVFIGKSMKANRFQQGTASPLSFAARWPVIESRCVGEWKRLDQCRTTQGFNFGVGAPDSADKPWKVTDIVRRILYDSGLPGTMVYVPDINMRLEAPAGSDAQGIYRVEPGTPTLSLITHFVRDYLGGYLMFDPNATNGGPSTDKNGMWRIAFASRPDKQGHFAPLVEFVRDAPWTDAIRSKLNLNSYPKVTAPAGNLMQTCPVLGQSLVESVEPPEFNVLIVSGTVIGDALTVYSGRLVTTLVNWPAVVYSDNQPIAPDPTNPDYTDGTVVIAEIVDNGLNTIQAVNFMARRTFDLAAHTIYWKSFTAPPVLVLDPNDPYQIRSRLLRYGDCVYMDSAYWFVHSCNLDIQGDRGGTPNSVCVYEIFQIPQLMGMGTSPLYSKGMNYSGSSANSY